MAALSDQALIKQVRAKTTSSVTQLPDSQILYFAGRAVGDDSLYSDNLYLGADGGALALDLFGVIADCWEYLARDDRYGSAQEGQVAISQPKAELRAAYYRAKSQNGGGAIVTQGRIERTDVGPRSYALYTEFGV